MIEEILKKDFNKIVREYDCKNFFQTSNMGTHLENKGSEVYYLAFNLGGKVVGATIMDVEYTFLGKKSFRCLKGVITDYKNLDCLKLFLTELINFVKQKGGFKLSIDPYIVARERDIDGEFVKGGVDNYDVINTIKAIGFKKSKIDTQVRFNFCLDIKGQTKDALFKNFSSNTKNRINRALREGVEIHTLNYDELAEFKKITEDTCKRRGFPDKSLEYYQSMYKVFKDEVTFRIARIDVKKYYEIIDNEIKTLEDTMKKEEVGKKKQEECKKKIELLENKKVKMKEMAQDKDVLDLAGAMFMLYGDESIYLFSGGYEEYKSLGGQYLLQWDIIKEAVRLKKNRHNFFGIFGFKDKSEENYGIYEFKRGFDGYVEELVGEYDYYLGGISTIIEKIKSIKNKRFRL